MKRNCIEILFTIACTLLLLSSGCKHALPVLTTAPVTKFTATTAVCSGKITFEGKPKFSSYGICYDPKPNPTIANLRTAHIEPTSGEFVNTISGLTADKTYYIRAYATNSAGTAYGEQISFTTTISAPQLVISKISDITNSSAICGSIITSSGGSNIQSCGICWDTLPKPTIKSSKTADNLVTTVFLSHLDGLKPNKTYFIRAYAINSVGTGYGEEKRFTTIKSIPSLTTTSVTDISLNSAICGAKIISDGGAEISEQGICWSTKPEPTITSSKTSEFYAPGKYRLTGLQVATTYYIRAYATNSSGTGYGEEVSFRTSGNTPVATTLDASNMSTTGAVLKAIVNPNQFSTQTSFDYGKTTEYGQNKVVPQSPVTGTKDKLVSTEINGLETGITYHFRVKAVNSIGTTYGKDLTFETSKVPVLTNFFPIQKNYNDTAFVITPPSSTSTGAFTYSSSNAKVAVIMNNKVRIIGPGTSVITATQAPAGSFTTGTITTTLTMNLTDIDGNVYKTIAIGSQDWMKENFRATRYSDGTPVPNEPDNKKWGTMTTGAYCWYNNDQANSKNANGALYNWYAVSSNHKLCPVGWHVASDDDWKKMELSLGMTVKQAEGTLKRSPGKAAQIKDTSGWIKDGKGTNATDFSALAAGFRSSTTGLFTNLGLDACWWTSTEDKADVAWLRNMYFSLNDIYRISDNKSHGFSVRCVRDK
jgi:uncharacterized protein (TIGR02145 family)